MPAVRSNHHFYPRPPRGGRHRLRPRIACTQKFLSTPSARRATPMTALVVGSRRYFYPRPPRGGRLVPGVVLRTLPDISIHALREEGDRLIVLVFRAVTLFLSTPSARRATVSVLNAITDLDVFLSTPSARRATRNARSTTGTRRNFYPRPPRGGRPGGHLSPRARRPISIHALREEGDQSPTLLPRGFGLFLSTPSARRATVLSLNAFLYTSYFYPRPPRGGRLRLLRYLYTW